MKNNPSTHHRRPLKTGLGLMLFTSGMVSALADLALAF
jgi:hypothetical protein